MTDSKTPTMGGGITLQLLADLQDLHGTHLSFSPDGRRWALADDRRIQLGREGTVEQRLTAPGVVHHLAFAPDATRLLACPHVYDLEQGAWVKLPRIDKALAAGLAEPPPPDQLGIAAGVSSPDGEELALAVRFQPSRELGAVDTYRGPGERLLLVRNRERTTRGALHEGDEELRAIALGERLVAAGGDTVLVWDRQSLRKLASLVHHKVVVRALAFSPAGDRLAAVAADGAVSLWDTTTWTRLAAFQGHDGDALAVAFHPRLPLLVTGGMDGKLRLWSLDPPGRLEREEVLGGWVRAVAFDPSGGRLAAVSRSSPPHLVLYALSAAAHP